MLNKVTYKQDTHVFTKGMCVSFRDITLLVGDQGAGKSSLLKDIKSDAGGGNTLDVTYDGELEGMLHFDTEKDSLRTRGPDPFEQREYAQAIVEKFVSHGEALLPYMRDLKQFKNSLILLDQPETALSIRSCLEVCSIIRHMLGTGNQFIIATHSPVIMQEFDASILDMEQNKYVSYEAFLKRQHKPKRIK